MCDVMQEGYRIIFSPVQFDSFKECKKACDWSNKLFFKPERSLRIIQQSMNNSLAKAS